MTGVGRKLGTSHVCIPRNGVGVSNENITEIQCSRASAGVTQVVDISPELNLGSFVNACVEGRWSGTSAESVLSLIATRFRKLCFVNIDHFLKQHKGRYACNVPRKKLLQCCVTVPCNCCNFTITVANCSMHGYLCPL